MMKEDKQSSCYPSSNYADRYLPGRTRSFWPQNPGAAPGSTTGWARTFAALATGGAARISWGGKTRPPLWHWIPKQTPVVIPCP